MTSLFTAPLPILGRLVRFIGRVLGWHASVSWEVHIQDHQGCWRVWSSGLSTKAEALGEMYDCKVKDKRWNPHLPGVFRVMRVFTVEAELGTSHYKTVKA